MSSFLFSASRRPKTPNATLLLPSQILHPTTFTGVAHSFTVGCGIAAGHQLNPLGSSFNEKMLPASGKDSRSLEVRFERNGSVLPIPFEDLSDGEKCFMICALVVASNAAYGPLFCFWDEPENHIGISEVGHLVVALRKAFSKGGQFIATSHNPEAIQRFSDENTLFLERKGHLEPTVVRTLSELHVHGDLVNALIRGDVEV